MGFFNKLFKGPEIDREKSDANAEKMRVLFNQVVEGGDDYRLIFGYTADVSRFNYGLSAGTKLVRRSQSFPSSPIFPPVETRPITAVLKSLKPAGTSIPPMPLSFTQIKKLYRHLCL